MTDHIEPLFDIVSYHENEDGTADVKISFSDEFIALYKKATKKKRATQRGLEKFLQETLSSLDEFKKK